MPRRQPPTALRLVTGPTPPRNRPKHTLPSIPAPTFHAASSITPKHAAPRQTAEKRARMTFAQLPPLDISFTTTSSGNTSPVSAGSVKSVGSIKGLGAGGKVQRGPWDHSGTIALDINVESMLAPLKPVAVSPGSIGSHW